MEINKIYQGDSLTILNTFPDKCMHVCITSPPYWGLRDYGCAGQMGNENTPEEYVRKMVNLFREVKRVLKDDGTLWLNLGDSYAGSGGTGNQFGQIENGLKPVRPTKINRAKDRSTDKWSNSKCKSTGDIKSKDLVGIPWMVAFALRLDGWYLRQDIIWNKPNPMPESVADRCTKSHEYIFLLSKSPKYYFNSYAIKEKAIYGGMNERAERQNENNKCQPTDMNNAIRKRPKNLQEKGQSDHTMHIKRDKRAGKGRIAYGGKRNGEEGIGQESFVSIPEYRNKRDVWTVTTKPYSGAHFATFPEDLILPCILAGCPSGGVVLDPFMGAGTTALVAKKNGCNFIGCELNPEYIEIANKRIAQEYLF